MGVPAFFRWLSRKYPKIVSPVLEDPDIEVDGVLVPPDYSGPNPNDELDNLYLDMNGIVHPCTHPEGRPAPKNEDEMMLEVFRYTDRVLTMARPRKILMIAIDGVAPRAKMNQQRSRRFRSAREARINNEAKEQAIAEAEARGEIIDNAIRDKTQWDSNAITPGTPFMNTLAASLRYWIAYKVSSDPGWSEVKVIISDASVPGEGEHKIMQFIRSQRIDPSYNPNTTHCIYGLDADLIFLGLATHEPHFKILREDVFADQSKPKSGGSNQNFGITEEDQKKLELDNEVEKAQRKPFIWLHIDILRQYLEIELQLGNLPFTYDFERALDDWVFMCFFCGNDFLPHLPSLDVRSNSVDMLTSMWRSNLARIGGYITCDGVVDMKRAEMLLQVLGQQEDNIFRSKLRREAENKRRRLENEEKTERARIKESGETWKLEARNRPEHDYQKEQKVEDVILDNNTLPAAPQISRNRTGDRAPVHPLQNMPLYTPSGESVGDVHMSNSELVQNRNAITVANMANKSAAQNLKSQLKAKTSEKKPEEKTDTGVLAVHSSDDEGGDKNNNDEEVDEEDGIPVKAGIKRAADGFERREDMDSFEDPIRLGEDGYRDRYYTLKFDAPEESPKRRDIVERYIEGVCWVLLYYYQGCPSWNWYFPYHYAPFAYDFKNLSDIEIKFNYGTPFRPYEQLMSVLPAASGHTLPEVFRPLMSDPDSDIIDFYPVDFEIDLNGNRFEWQGVAVLPFIDEHRLLEAVHKKYPELTPEETARNTHQHEILIVSGRNKIYKQVFEKLYKENNEKKLSFRSNEAGGLSGAVSKDEGYGNKKVLLYPLSEGSMPNIPVQDAVLFATYKMPIIHTTNKSMLLPGVKLRDPVFTPTEESIIRSKMNERRKHGNQNQNSLHGNNALGRNEHLKVPGRVGGFENFIGLEKAGQLSGSDLQTQQGFRGNFNSGSGQGYNSGYNGRGGYNNGPNNRGGYNRGGYNSRPNNRGGYNNQYNNRNNNYNNRGNNYNNHNGGGHNNNGYNQSSAPPYAQQNQYQPTAHMPFANNAFGQVGNNNNQGFNTRPFDGGNNPYQNQGGYNNNNNYDGGNNRRYNNHNNNDGYNNNKRARR